MPRQWTHCPKCGAKTKRTATKAQSRPKRRKSQQERQKPLSMATASKRLHAAGLATDTQIADGLRTGATANALYGDSAGTTEGVFLRYMQIVARVADGDSEVLAFCNRLVSYRAE
jgi:hypothetical protein